jgi:hypothetical protein
MTDRSYRRRGRIGNYYDASRVTNTRSPAVSLIICCLVDDEGRPCQRQFSGVIDFPYPVASTSTYLQVDPANHFWEHLLRFHRHIQPGTFDIVIRRGRFFVEAVIQNPAPSPMGSENTVEGLKRASYRSRPYDAYEYGEELT